MIAATLATLSHSTRGRNASTSCPPASPCRGHRRYFIRTTQIVAQAASRSRRPARRRGAAADSDSMSRVVSQNSADRPSRGPSGHIFLSSHGLVLLSGYHLREGRRPEESAEVMAPVRRSPPDACPWGLRYSA